MRINVCLNENPKTIGLRDISVEVEDFNYKDGFPILQRIFSMLGIEDCDLDENKRPDGPENAGNGVSTPSFDQTYKKIMAEGDYEDMKAARKEAFIKGETFSTVEFYKNLNEERREQQEKWQKQEEVICSGCNEVIEEQGFLRVSMTEAYCRNCEKERDEQLTRIAEKIAGDDDGVISKVLAEVDKKKVTYFCSVCDEVVKEDKMHVIYVNDEPKAICRECQKKEKVDCTKCRGTGRMHTGMKKKKGCPRCGGTGKILREKEQTAEERFRNLKKLKEDVSMPEKGLFIFDSEGNKITLNWDGSVPCTNNCHHGKVHTGMGAPDCQRCAGTGKISIELFNKIKETEEYSAKIQQEKKDNG